MFACICVQAAELSGGELFGQNCAACHLSDGLGISNVFPALSGSEVVNGSAIDVALVLLIGRGDMPSFSGSLDNADIAAIINYVRNSWGNRGELITAAEIRQLMAN